MAKIFVVDDEPMLITAMSMILLSEGHEVVTEQDSGKAQERLRSSPDFDLGMFDVRMNPVDGLQLLQEVQDHCPRMQVIMVTAYHTDELAKDGLARGAYAYLAKPFSVDDIIQTVRGALLQGEKGS